MCAHVFVSVCVCKVLVCCGRLTVLCVFGVFQGYMKRQAVFACNTCVLAGVCLCKHVS